MSGKITYKDEWYKIDQEGNEIQMDEEGNELLDIKKIEKFKNDFIKHPGGLLINRSKEAQIKNQKNFIEYLFNIIEETEQFHDKITRNLLDELDESISNNNDEFMRNHTQFFSDFRNKDADEMVGLLRSIGKDFLEKCKNKELYEIRKGGRKRKTRKKTGNGHALSKIKRRFTSRRIPAQVRVTPIEVVPPLGSIPVHEAQLIYDRYDLAQEAFEEREKIKDAEVTTGTPSKGGKRSRKKRRKKKTRKKKKRRKKKTRNKKGKGTKFSKNSSKKGYKKLDDEKELSDERMKELTKALGMENQGIKELKNLIKKNYEKEDGSLDTTRLNDDLKEFGFETDMEKFEKDLK